MLELLLGGGGGGGEGLDDALRGAGRQRREAAGGAEVDGGEGRRCGGEGVLEERGDGAHVSDGRRLDDGVERRHAVARRARFLVRREAAAGVGQRRHRERFERVRGLDAALPAAEEAGEGGVVFEVVCVRIEVFLDAGLDLVLGPLIAEAQRGGDFLELRLFLGLEGTGVDGHDGRSRER